jgi:hypothetical protein
MSVEQLGNALQSTDIAKQIAAYHRELEKGHDAEDEVIMAFAKMAENLSVLSPEFDDLHAEMAEGNILSEAMQLNLERITSGMINAGMAAKSFAQNQESLNKSLDKTIRKFAKVPYQDLEKNLSASIQGIKDELGIISGVTVDGQVKFGGTGAKFMDDPALKDMLGDKLVGELGQYRVSSEFGMFSDTENRVAEREQKRKDFETRMRSSDAYSQFDMNRNISNTHMPGYQSDPFKRDANGIITGILEDQEAIDAGMMASTNFVWGQDNFLESLETLREEYKLIAQDAEALNEQEKEDLESKKLRIDYLREQMHLNKNVNLLQEAGFKLGEDKSKNLLNLALARLEVDEAGTARTKFDMDLATNTANQEKADLKVQEKKLDIQAAQMAVQHAEEKIRTKLLEENKESNTL